ncbi:MAG: PmeII family type II restriction endonuclease [Chloroflexota bacterium]
MTQQKFNLDSYLESQFEKINQQKMVGLIKIRFDDLFNDINPYLLSCQTHYIVTFYDLVKNLLDAHLSSQEETIFGEFLEGLAIYICGEVYHGRKSSAEGIDLEFTRDGILYLISIKSGPNWGNSSQVKKMIDNFKKAQRILRTNNPAVRIQAVNGCCYGRDAQPDKGDYLKLCGQAFWEFISGDSDLYIELIEPLGYQARQKNEAFSLEYGRILNLFTLEVASQFSLNGSIDWQRLLRFNSGKTL